MMAQCNACSDPDTAFRVPWDHAGEALMRAHFEDKHPEIELTIGTRR